MSFRKFLEESKQEDKEREFVFMHMEDTDVTHDELKKMFKKKFGNLKNFDMYVTEFMDG